MEYREFQEICTKLSEMNNYLEQIRDLLRFSSRNAIKDVLLFEIDSELKIKVYDLFDGNNSVRDIERLTLVNRNTVSQWGQKWEKAGLLASEKGTSKPKRKKLFSLEEFGIIPREMDELS